MNKKEEAFGKFGWGEMMRNDKPKLIQNFGAHGGLQDLNFRFTSAIM